MVFKTGLTALLLIVFSSGALGNNTKGISDATANWKRELATKASLDLTVQPGMTGHEFNDRWHYAQLTLKTQAIPHRVVSPNQSYAMHGSGFGHHSGWAAAGLMLAMVTIVLIVGMH